MSGRSGRFTKYYNKNSGRNKLDSTIYNHIVRDEIDAIYQNDLVKRKNKQIRRQRRARKILPVTLAKMPWDE